MASDIPMPRLAFARCMSTGKTITRQFLTTGGRPDIVNQPRRRPAGRA